MKDRQVAVRFTVEDFKKLMDLAKKMEMSRADVMRLALNQMRPETWQERVEENEKRILQHGRDIKELQEQVAKMREMIEEDRREGR